MKIRIKLFAFLFLGFIVATIIGTISHEFGHYLVAKYWGFKSQIHYGYTSWSTGNVFENPYHIRHILSIALGGPVSTMLTSMVGLVFIFISGSKHKDDLSLSFLQWIYIFLALFSLRFCANLFIWLVGITRPIPSEIDEIRIAMYLGWPHLILMILTACIGVCILAIVFFKFIPRRQRLSFLLAGIVGGPAGFVLWLKWLGPLILP